MGRGTAVATPASGLLYGALTRTRNAPEKAPVELAPNLEFRATMGDTGLNPFIDNLNGYSGGKFWMALGPLPEKWHWKSAKMADAAQLAKSAEMIGAIEVNLGDALEVEVGDVEVVGLAARRTVKEMDGLQGWNINANALEAAIRVSEGSGRRVTSYKVVPRIGAKTFNDPEEKRWGALVGLSSSGELLLHVAAKPILSPVQPA